MSIYDTLLFSTTMHCKTQRYILKYTFFHDDRITSSNWLIHKVHFYVMYIGIFSDLWSLRKGNITM